MANWFRGPRPEQLEEDAQRERNEELDRVAEQEREANDAVPHRHPVRRFFARLRRKR